MINYEFLKTLGIPTPYRVLIGKDYSNGTISNINENGTAVIDLPFIYYSIEKIGFNYKAVDLSNYLSYAVAEIWYAVTPASDPVFNHRFIRDSSAPLTNMKSFLKYARQGSSAEDIFFNCVFNNKSNNVYWEWKMTFGTAVDAVDVWLEISGNYYT